MRRTPARILRWMAVLGGLTLLLFPLAAPPEALFEAPLLRVEKTRGRLVRQLADRGGLLNAMTFDEPVPAEFLSGRTFLFSGTVAGPVTVTGSGTLAPGASAGTLHTGALTLTGSASFKS